MGRLRDLYDEESRLVSECSSVADRLGEIRRNIESIEKSIPKEFQLEEIIKNALDSQSIEYSSVEVTNLGRMYSVAIEV